MRGGFEVPGYQVEGLLGAGGTGEVWLATEESSHRQIALKRLRLDPAAGADAVRRLVATLDALDHPHVLRVRRIDGEPTEPVLVCDYAESGSLGQLLRARDRLDPGEAVTVIGPIAEALAAVHSRGLVHGAVTPENVLFTEDGRPLLADTALWSLTEIDPSAAGTHGLTDPRVIAGAEPSAAADVYGLAATAWTALTGAPVAEPRPSLLSVNPGVPPGLAHAIESGLQADPDVRPSADQLADMIYAAAAPAAVRFPIGLVLDDPSALTTTTSAPSPSPAPSPTTADAAMTSGLTPLPSKQTRRALGLSPLVLAVAGAAALVVLAGLVVGGIALIGAVRHRAVADPVVTAPASVGPFAGATPTGSPGPPSVNPVSAADWTQLLTGLMAVRAQAFTDADGTTLDQVFVQGSPAMRYDAAEMAKLSTAGAHAENLDIAVSGVKVTTRSGESAALSAITQAKAYDIVQADGSRTRHPIQDPKTAPIVLHKAADGSWLIYQW
ncbi:MAG TPA: serine/threonine-protein kinase [Actinopolymorphaceae bacterium]|jgi:serine/threonine protein kinase